MSQSKYDSNEQSCNIDDSLPKFGNAAVKEWPKPHSNYIDNGNSQQVSNFLTLDDLQPKFPSKIPISYFTKTYGKPNRTKCPLPRQKIKLNKYKTILNSNCFQTSHFFGHSNPNTMTVVCPGPFGRRNVQFPSKKLPSDFPILNNKKQEFNQK